MSIATLAMLGILLVLAACCLSMVLSARAARWTVDTRDSPSNALEQVLSEHSVAHPGGRLELTVGWVSFREHAIEAVTSAFPWRLGPAFTGVALCITFYLIGDVLTSKLGPTIAGSAIASENQSLSDAVETMGSKFWISAAGVVATMVHAAVRYALIHSLRRRIDASLNEWRRGGRIELASDRVAREAAETAAKLTSLIERIERASSLQLETLRGVQGNSSQLAVGVERLVSMTQDLCEQEKRSADHLDSVDAALQGGLAPVVENIEKIAGSLLSGRGEELLARLEKAFREGLKQGLADVVVPLEGLRGDIKGSSPEQALREIADRLHGAMTGGASDSAVEFRRALDDLGRALPGILAEMRQATVGAQQASLDAMAGFRAELSNQGEVARKANDEVLRAVAGVLDRIDAASASMSTAVTVLTQQSSFEMNKMIEALTTQSAAAAQRVSEAAAAAEMDSRARRARAAEEDEATFSSFIKDIAQLRNDVVEAERSTAELLERIRFESAQTLKLIGEEQSALGGTLEAVRGSASALHAAGEGMQRTHAGALSVAKELDAVARGFAETTKAEQLLIETSRSRVNEIVEGREQIETSLLRITAAVADLLKRELVTLREQHDASRLAMLDLVSKVDQNLVSQLATQVEDLGSAVSRLEKAVHSMSSRT